MGVCLKCCNFILLRSLVLVSCIYCSSFVLACVWPAFVKIIVIVIVIVIYRILTLLQYYNGWWVGHQIFVCPYIFTNIVRLCRSHSGADTCLLLSSSKRTFCSLLRRSIRSKAILVLIKEYQCTGFSRGYSHAYFTLPTRTRQNCLLLTCPCRRCEVNWRQDKTVLSCRDPISNLQLFSLKYTEDYWKLGNWKLGRNKTKPSCLVANSIFMCHTIITAI